MTFPALFSADPLALQLLNALREPACLISPDGQHFHHNRAFLQAFGQGSTLQAVLPPEDFAEMLNALHPAGEKQPVVLSCRVRGSSGEQAQELDISALLQANRVTAWLARLPASSAALLAMQDIKKERDFLHKLTDEVPATLQIRDMASNAVLFTNRYSTEVLGYTWDEVKDLTPEQAIGFFHPDDLLSLFQLAEKLQHLQEGGSLEGEYRMRHKDGEWRWIYARLSIFARDAAGNPLQSLSVGLDNTQRKKAELELQASEKRLQNLMEGHTRFVSDASHEIKTPIAGIQGNLEVLLRYPHIPEEEKREIIQDCHREAMRLGRLVQDLLSMARTGRGLLMLDTEVRLDHLVLDTLRDFESIRGNHHLQLGEIAECTVEGDPDRLKQLLVILTGNALKYTPGGGTITLALQCNEDQAVLSIQDSGIGIAAEDLPRVFERYFRASHEALGQDPGGTGLGLPIARWIVEQHGGTIELHSQQGVGTEVVVQLPTRA
ncbi:sensor histidine kinase [Deinococcus roseus]|uniref:histidine kinase n=1 Tax=Deinococcus roseus TaxID=392414 RepID=A0ABQ2D3L6_9DEIO|nr:ATP-binding protein [Deinococcus roseus]GGJ42808.1 hypothetical protein GCM10008938_31230 [Deinococcus roseus]